MKTVIKHLFIFLLIFSLKASGQHPADKIEQVENNLVGYIQIFGDAPKSLVAQMANYHVPGVSIAVIKNYKLMWAKGYGIADDSSKSPVTTQTPFQAGSVSKSLNALGVMRLAQENKLNLYADVDDYLTSWKLPYDSAFHGKKVTMAELLSHTGGINLSGFPGYSRGYSLPTVVQILNGRAPANTPRIRQEIEPGKLSVYSGGGVLISEQVVVDITHQRYSAYMENAVLLPLGMTNSSFELFPNDAHIKDLASGHYLNGQQVYGKYRVYPEQAAAGLWTTPTDLARYIIETQLAFKGKSVKVLNQANTRLRLTPYLNPRSALGVFIDSLDGIKYFQHNGATSGFRCQYYGSINKGNGVVVMVNSDHDEIITEIINSVAKIYGFKGLNRSVIKKSVNLAYGELQPDTGTYVLSSNPQFNLTISIDNAQLYAALPGRSRVKIIPQSLTRFFMLEMPIEFEFIRATDGKIIAVDIYETGNTTRLEKGSGK